MKQGLEKGLTDPASLAGNAMQRKLYPYPPSDIRYEPTIEETIAQVADYNVASNEKLGVTGILESIAKALKNYVPKEWGIDPHLKISSLTREHLPQGGFDRA